MYTRLPAVAYRTTSYGTTFYLDLAQKSNVGKVSPVSLAASSSSSATLFTCQIPPPTSYTSSNKKKIRKRRTSANQAARIFFSKYSFLKTYLKRQ